MTYVILSLAPSDVDFHHPLSEDLVAQATEYIKEELNSVILDHDDSETRAADLRRTHAPLSSSAWIIRYKNNKIMVTNQIADDSSRQFEALTSGNGMGPICAQHMTRQVSKGWSGNDRHRPLYKGGKKRLEGDLGPIYPGFLKYYDKRKGIWQYKHCVRPIRSSIIEDVNRDIRRAVFLGLEKARYEMYDDRDKDTGGSDEPEDEGMTSPPGGLSNVEELMFTHDSKTKQERDLEDYRTKKLEEKQLTMKSQLRQSTEQERSRDIISKSGQEKAEKRGKDWYKNVMIETGLAPKEKTSRTASRSKKNSHMVESDNKKKVRGEKWLEKMLHKAGFEGMKGVSQMNERYSNQTIRDLLHFGVK
jgi:hypothetical protein